MKERYDIILGEVVKAYLDTGKPVGSGTISRQGKLSLSSASIRNVMADLERMGLLHAPHTSAGRVPTDRGLRYFVDTLMVVDEHIRQQAEQIMARHLDKGLGVNALLKQASDELASLTNFAGLVSVSEHRLSGIRRVELIPVSPEQVLAVIVSELGEVQNRLIHRMPEMADERLPELSWRLTELLNGCDVPTARQRLYEAMESDRLRIRGLLEGLMQWVGAPAGEKTDIFVSGQRRLLEVPELSVIETVRSLVTAFDEKETLIWLVDQVERASRGVKVFIGSEHALVNMDQVSVVLARFQGPGQAVGALGVIGPKRMHYERVLPLVDGTAKWVGRILGGGF